MKYLLILLPLIVFSGEYYDICNGKEYTVSKGSFIDYHNKDKNISSGIPFAKWIRCTDKDMNISTTEVPKVLNINGRTYRLNESTHTSCVPFGEKHNVNGIVNINWRKCRRDENDWQET